MPTDVCPVTPAHADPAETIVSSFNRLVPRADWIAKYFYAHLFTNHPEVRSMFPENMAHQRDRFLYAMIQIVGGLAEGRFPVSYLSRLGADHARDLGVVAEHYPAVGDSLIATLKKFHGLRWTHEIEATWLDAYQQIADVMIKAGEAQTSGPARLTVCA